MNWRQVVVASLRAIVIWWQWIVAVIAIAAFLAPLVTPPTEDNPTADAGLFAPVIALCVAAMVLTQAAVQARGLKVRTVPNIGIGIASMASAYLWIADEAETHPLDPELPVVLLALLIAAALATIAIPTIAIPILAWGSKPQSNDEKRKD